MKLITHILLALTAGVPLGADALTINVRECVDMAVASSEKIAEATNSIEKARLQAGVARTAYLPKLDGSATAAWVLPDSKYEEMGMTMKMRGLYMAGLNITQPIYAGGKITAANRMADIGRKAASDQLDMELDRVTADAESSYWTYVAVLSKVEMMKAYMEQIDTVYSQTLASVNAGMATRNDLLRIEARRSQVVYQLEQVTNGADMCRMALCNTIGVDLTTPLEVADTEVPVEVPGDLDAYDLANRPEMKLMAADVAVKEQQVKSVRADYLPQLGLQAGWMAYGNFKVNSMVQDEAGNYHKVSQNIHDNNFSIMLGLQVPLFHWGEGARKIKAAKIDVENSRLNLEENERLLNLQVSQAISNVRTGQRMLVAAETAMRQADMSLASTLQSYEVGLNTLTDMLDAQSQWQMSRSNLIEAQTQLRIYVIDYLHATARLR